jgi:hypothetical protein
MTHSEPRRRLTAARAKSQKRAAPATDKSIGPPLANPLPRSRVDQTKSPAVIAIRQTRTRLTAFALRRLREGVFRLELQLVESMVPDGIDMAKVRALSHCARALGRSRSSMCCKSRAASGDLIPLPETARAGAPDARVGRVRLPLATLLEAFSAWTGDSEKVDGGDGANQRPRRVRYSKIRLMGDEPAPASRASRGRPRKADARRRATTLAGRGPAVDLGTDELRRRKHQATSRVDLEANGVACSTGAI